MLSLEIRFNIVQHCAIMCNKICNILYMISRPDHAVVVMLSAFFFFLVRGVHPLSDIHGSVCEFHTGKVETTL